MWMRENDRLMQLQEPQQARHLKKVKRKNPHVSNGAHPTGACISHTSSWAR